MDFRSNGNGYATIQGEQVKLPRGTVLDNFGVPWNKKLLEDVDPHDEDGRLLDADSRVIPNVYTYTGLVNTYAKTYSYRFDEALKHLPENALAMRRDTFIQAMLQERYLPTAVRPWEIVPEDPEEEDAKEEAKVVQRAIARTPDLTMALLALSDAAWYGRYGLQVDHAKEDGLWSIGSWDPLNGDKIQYRWGGKTPAVFIYSAIADRYPKEYIVYTDRVPALVLGKEKWRRQFIIHRFRRDDADYFEPEMAGRMAGIGLRDQIYWSWWLRDELLSWAVDFMKKVGTLGLMVFWYELGNKTAKAEAQDNAKRASHDTVLVMGRPSGNEQQTWGVDHFPAQHYGIEALQRMIADYFESHMERLIIGQTLSSDSEGSGLGGTGVADLHKETKHNLLKYDAINMGETLSRDLVRVIHKLNFPKSKHRLKWQFNIEDPFALQKLDAINKGYSMGVDYRTDSVRALSGEKKPEPGEDRIGMNVAAEDAAAAGQMPDQDQMGGGGQQLPGGWSPTASGRGFWNPTTRQWKPAGASLLGQQQPDQNSVPGQPVMHELSFYSLLSPEEHASIARKHSEEAHASPVGTKATIDAHLKAAKSHMAAHAAFKLADRGASNPQYRHHAIFHKEQAQQHHQIAEGHKEMFGLESQNWSEIEMYGISYGKSGTGGTLGKIGIGDLHDPAKGPSQPQNPIVNRIKPQQPSKGPTVRQYTPGMKPPSSNDPSGFWNDLSEPPKQGKPHLPQLDPSHPEHLHSDQGIHHPPTPDWKPSHAGGSYSPSTNQYVPTAGHPDNEAVLRVPASMHIEAASHNHDLMRFHGNAAIEHFDNLKPGLQHKVAAFLAKHAPNAHRLLVGDHHDGPDGIAAHKITEELSNPKIEREMKDIMGGELHDATKELGNIQGTSKNKEDNVIGPIKQHMALAAYHREKSAFHKYHGDHARHIEAMGQQPTPMGGGQGKPQAGNAPAPPTPGPTQTAQSPEQAAGGIAPPAQAPHPVEQLLEQLSPAEMRKLGINPDDLRRKAAEQAANIAKQKQDQAALAAETANNPPAAATVPVTQPQPQPASSPMPQGGQPPNAPMPAFDTRAALEGIQNQQNRFTPVGGKGGDVKVDEPPTAQRAEPEFAPTPTKKTEPAPEPKKPRYSEILRSHAKQLADTHNATASAHNEMLRDAIEMSDTDPNKFTYLGNLTSRLASGKAEDPGDIRGFDEVAQVLARKYPEYFDTSEAADLNLTDQLLNHFRTGKKKLLTAKEAEERAHEELEGLFATGQAGQVKEKDIVPFFNWSESLEMVA